MNRLMLEATVPRIDLANLIEDLKEKSRRSLKEAIEAYQANLLDQLCGEKRKPNGVYRRAGSARRPKAIITSLGMVKFRLLKVKRRATGETLTPILDVLDVRGRKYTRQMKAQCAELTSKLSYGDASEEYNRITDVLIPKSTIHGFTQELVPAMLQTILNSATPSQPERQVILMDGTEVRSVERDGFNQVRVGISVDEGGKQLLNLTVNQPYTAIPKDSILVSDGDPVLKSQEPWRHQLCIIHAV